MNVDEAKHVQGPISRFSRREKLLGGIDVRRAKGLEIGALASPLVRSHEGNIRFVDHVDTETLRAKYANDPNVDVDAIVQVDAVWGERTLADCFPGELFDYVIASHVAEHVPDLVGWLLEVGAVLRPGGRLILAVPDRRYSFDFFRRETSLSELIDNFLRKVRRPTPGQVFDFNANAAAVDLLSSWKPSDETANPRRYMTMQGAFRRAEKSNSGAYIDGHCSVFTAPSLLHLLDGLLELNLLPYSIERFHIAELNTNEMTLILSRNSAHPPPQARRTVCQLLETGVDSEGLPLNFSVDEKPAFAPELQERVRELELALLEMTASISWKMTKPLRALGRYLHALRHTLKII